MFCCYFVFNSSVIANEIDPFIVSAELGGDSTLPDATISDPQPIEFDSTPLVLNDGAGFYNVAN